MTLEDFTRYVAAGIATLGAFVVSPQGAVLLIRRVWTPIEKGQARLARWLPFLRRTTTVSTSRTTSWLTLSDSVKGRVRPAWPEQPTVKALSNAVQNWLDRVDHELDTLWSALDRERSERKQDVEGGRSALQGSLADLKALMEVTEHQAAEHDSRALPLFGIGAVMGTIPGEFAALPRWLYVLLLFVAVATSVDAAISAWRLRRRGRAAAV